MVTSTCISIITLNVNGLNALIKRYRVMEWIKKKKTHKIHLYMQIESEGMKGIYHANGSEKKAEQQYLDKIDFETKTVARDKEGQYILKSYTMTK